VVKDKFCDDPAKEVARNLDILGRDEVISVAYRNVEG
jgi:hypothetical protein